MRRAGHGFSRVTRPRAYWWWNLAIYVTWQTLAMLVIAEDVAPAWLVLLASMGMGYVVARVTRWVFDSRVKPGSTS